MFMYLVAQRSPMIERAGKLKTLEIFNCAIHGYPRHHFGVSELLTFSTYLPDALIGLHPNVFEMGYPISLYCCTLLRHSRCTFPGLMHCISNFTIDIQLELSSCGVADTYRLGVLVTGQPRNLPLEQTPLAGNAIHDLILRRLSGNGSHQPVTQRRGLAVKSRVHESQESKCRIPQPAITIIPVPLATQLLRKRRCGRGNDSARRRICERLKNYEGALNRISSRPLVGALGNPVQPKAFGLRQSGACTDWQRRRVVRETVHDHEGYCLTTIDNEISFYCAVRESQRGTS